MNFVRNLKQGMSGTDVRYMKDKLFTLGYYPSSTTKISNSTFGKDTLTAVKSFQTKNKLEVDGIIGTITWSAIEKASTPATITFTRNLKKGMSGKDVRYMKDCLFALDYFTNSIKKITSNSFGTDTLNAVTKFQRVNKLETDGIIGKLTWVAIETAYKSGKKYVEPKEEETVPADAMSLAQINAKLNTYTHISAAHRNAIAADLAKVSRIRQEIVLEILSYAYDADVPGDTRALYIFGANLYNTNLQINYADEAEIEKHAARYPDYFNGGRKEWMLAQVARNPYLPSSDCSGMEVGYLRKHGFVSSSFDTTANNFCTSSKFSSNVDKSKMRPADWVGKSGHIGTYVGGGLCVEFYGGAYGCQLTDINNRRGYDFVSKKIRSGSPWTRYRRPVYY